MGRKHAWLVVAALVGCSVDDEPATSTNTAALTSTNALWQNSLSTNALWQNALWQNALWQNALWQNALWQNALWQNSLSTNALWQNALWQNALWQNSLAPNALWQNALWQNALWQNALWQNALWQNGLTHDLLENNPYTRQVLSYLYSCAMPEGATKTLDAGDGLTVTFQGGVGLWPTWARNADGTTCNAECQAKIESWKSLMPDEAPDVCGESCQRWLSACILARTNAYGTKVEISMRAPDDAPAGIRDALKVSETERAGWDLREGAYYGNIFQTYPDGDPRVEGTKVIQVPQYFACAGPGSNIPDITKRFSSSQGATTVITNTGICEPTDGREGACTPTAGGETNCFAPGAAATASTPEIPDRNFREVITVYLKHPIATCGNGVCEVGEGVNGEFACVSDCHPEGWGITVDERTSSASRVPLTFRTVVSPSDGSIVVAGRAASGETIDLDGAGGVPAVTASTESILLARYTANSVLVSQRLYATTWSRAPTMQLAINANNEVAMLGIDAFTVWVMKFDASGAIEQTWSQATGAGQLLNGALGEGRHATAFIEFASDGGVVIGGSFYGVAQFGATSITSAGNAGYDPFVVKLAANGTVSWAVRFGDTSHEQMTSMKVDDQDNIFLASIGASDNLRKVTPAGALAWSKPLPTSDGIGLAVHGGNVYATGMLVQAQTWDFGTGPMQSPWTVYSLYVASYAGNGSARWAAMRGTMFTGFGFVTTPGSYIDVTPSGTVVAAGIMGSQYGGIINFGAGAFPVYESSDAFLVGFADDGGAYRWSKHVPFVIDGRIGAMHVDGEHVLLSGYYSGSMLVDNRLLVTNKPELPYVSNVFVSSFKLPSATDTRAPLMKSNATPEELVQAPAPAPVIYANATNPTGAVVWYLPPLVVDMESDEHTGYSVYCDPPSTTVFRIGDTGVTCKATDAVGNESTYQFTVRVLDTIGPEISLPGTITATATSASGAEVSFAPTAKDQVSGPADVTCDAVSGMFAIKTTLVTCSATDTAGNTTTGSFNVRVVDGAPVVTVPADFTATSLTPVIAATATDTVDGSLTPTCLPSPLVVGPNTVTCRATDSAGNTASKTLTVTVQLPSPPPAPAVVGWSGILQPINADGSSIFKIGSTVPAKFRLTGGSAGNATLVAHLSWVKTASGVSGDVLEASTSTTPDTGNTFRYDPVGDLYIFNLATKGMTAGTYTLRIDLGDGVTHDVEISLKK